MATIKLIQQNSSLAEESEPDSADDSDCEIFEAARNSTMGTDSTNPECFVEPCILDVIPCTLRKSSSEPRWLNQLDHWSLSLSATSST
eukprot:3939170-Rhodomonas_salina.2